MSKYKCTVLNMNVLEEIFKELYETTLRQQKIIIMIKNKATKTKNQNQTISHTVITLRNKSILKNLSKNTKK